MTSIALMRVLVCLAARVSFGMGSVGSQISEAPAAFEEDLANAVASPKALLRAESRGSLSMFTSHSDDLNGKLQAAVDTAGNVNSLELAQTEEVSQPEHVTQQTPVGDVDCLWEDWREWSVCQFTCGGGQAMRTRKVKIMAQGSGAACDDNVRETRQCAKNDCPVDCRWDDWGDWSACSESCGPGTKAKSRKFKQVAAFGGLTCQGLTTQPSECNLGDCPVDCKYGDWESWGGCSKSCGGGARKRFRPMAVTPNAVGKQCEAVGKNVEEAECGQNNCPVDCELEDWTAWDLCDVSCAQGSTKRTRAIKGDGASFGGKPCGEMLQSKTCDNGLCPADCKLSDWSDWHDCAVTCGAGTRKRSRTVAEAGNALGAKCPTDEASRSQAESCSMNGCPVDCKMGDWTDWTGCSATCGAGINERYRENKVHAEFGGRPCYHNTTYEKKYCSSDACPVDCEWDDWQDWRGCSTTCGNGTGLRMRNVRTPAFYGGKECAGGYSQNRDCNLRYCPLHCQWSDWTNWTSCSNTCGQGNQARSRQVDVQADYGGLPCAGATQQSRSCEDVPCPIHCVWADWAGWSSCSVSCGEGQHSRNRSIGTEPNFGGEPCAGDASETKPCDDLPNCPVDCEWDSWTEWQGCSKTCGEAVSKRSRIRKTYEEYGGHVCWGTEDDEQPCTLDPCPVDCVPGDWSQWGSCSKTCGDDGEHLRTRGIKTPARYNGQDCGPRNSSKPCELGPCPVDCQWTEWEPWATCSKSCNGGVTSRKRSEKTAALNNGMPCHGASREDAPCNVEGCAVDCVWDVWSDWSSCDVTCGGGLRRQHRQVKTEPKWGGAQCPPPGNRSESCNEQSCPVDCCWSSWTAFSLCSKSCDSGTMSRTRAKQPTEAYGGVPCVGDSEESNFCNTQGCPRDCQWQAWSQWTECSKKCGGGKIKRFRDVSVTRKNGGEKCVGLFEQEADCNVEECPQDCQWGEWSDWGSCPATCDGGIRMKSRQKKQDELHGGRPCEGNATEHERCGWTPCPVDCVLETWGDWGPCSASCGGERVRKRVKAKEMYGGKPCNGEMGEKAPCDTAGVRECPGTTTTTTVGATTTTTKKPIKPCNNGASDNRTSDNQLKQVDDAIRKLGSASDGNANNISDDDATKELNKSFNTTKLSDQDTGKTNIAEVAGDLSLTVVDGDNFISGFSSNRALTQAIADIAMVQSELVKVRLSLIQGLLLATWRRRATGNVNVAFSIEVAPDSASKPADIAARFTGMDISDVTKVVQKRLTSEGIMIGASAVSLSVTVYDSKPTDAT